MDGFLRNYNEPTGFRINGSNCSVEFPYGSIGFNTERNTLVRPNSYAGGRTGIENASRLLVNEGLLPPGIHYKLQDFLNTTEIRVSRFFSGPLVVLSGLVLTRNGDTIRNMFSGKNAGKEVIVNTSGGYSSEAIEEVERLATQAGIRLHGNQLITVVGDRVRELLAFTQHGIMFPWNAAPQNTLLPSYRNAPSAHMREYSYDRSPTFSKLLNVFTQYAEKQGLTPNSFINIGTACEQILIDSLVKEHQNL
jgi:hypothetical protein